MKTSPAAIAILKATLAVVLSLSVIPAEAGKWTWLTTPEALRHVDLAGKSTDEILELVRSQKGTIRAVDDLARHQEGETGISTEIGVALIGAFAVLGFLAYFLPGNHRSSAASDEPE